MTITHLATVEPLQFWCDTDHDPDEGDFTRCSGYEHITLHPARTAEGWVWCDFYDNPVRSSGSASCPDDCPGPHRRLLIGGEA